MGGGIAVARSEMTSMRLTDVGGQSDFRDIECREGICCRDGRGFLQDSTSDMLNLIRIRSMLLNLTRLESVSLCIAAYKILLDDARNSSLIGK